MLESESYTQFVTKSKPNILIDCGHTAIKICDDVIYFGKDGCGPSVTEIETVKLALKIYDKLIAEGKHVALNFCYADVSYNVTPQDRIAIKKIFSKKIIIPSEYQSILDQAGKHVSFYQNFQSVNSNIATSVLKKIKKTIVTESREQLYQKYRCAFLQKNSTTFGLFSPELVHEVGCKEDYLLDRYITITDRDTLEFPLINLQRSSFIGLFDKLDGIICPGTYMGNLFNMPENYDVIGIYSRSDDGKIREKILAGALSYKHLSGGSRNFMSIVNQNKAGSVEFYFLKSSSKHLTEEKFFSEVNNLLIRNQEIEWYQK